MEKIIRDMVKKVNEFHRKMSIPVNNGGGLPDITRYDHLLEELAEIIEAHGQDDKRGVVDGLVDFIYVAIGSLLQMGIDPTFAFDIVHEANMKKIGMKTARHEHDAVKPEGWTPPNHAAMLERLEVLNQVSPVFIDLTRLRIKKGKNYNRGTVTRGMHFPLGHLSFFQVVWMKMCRVRSMVENPDADSQRLIEREVNDIMVYSCFWAEFMRGIEI